ncbi:MAG TPA: hypothetical protein VJ180_08500 [Pyrinomonadaceae bacterium]|nr:hypothetical protein [Pyrinomonadaceae bacterium]
MVKKSTIRKSSKRKRITQRSATAHASAVAVLELMNSGKVPEFLYTAIKETIAHAAEYLNRDPFYPTFRRTDSDRSVDKNILMSIFSLAVERKLTSRELENTPTALARHVVAIYKHPLTPANLCNAIGEFVTDGTNEKYSTCEVSPEVFFPGDVSLVEEWSWRPETIARIIKLSNKYRETEQEASHGEN